MLLKRLLNGLDNFASKAHLRISGESPGLSFFLFHGIFEDQSAINQGLLYPQERLTAALLREFLQYFLALGYTFLTPAEALGGNLSPDKKYALLTFDDGYFNNTLALPVLEEFRVPALFFIATAYILEGRAFWSDVLYRERKSRGANDEAILQELMALKSNKVADIFALLAQSFGPESLVPRGDSDRPMTAKELQLFARHPYVHLGNHTHWHEVLTNLSPEEITAEISSCQTILTELTGHVPDWISYPNGSYNKAVLDAARPMNFSAGITTQQSKLPVGQLACMNWEQRMQLPRFNPATINSRFQYERLRSSFQLKTYVKKWLK